jgi:hypothetical protein
MRRFLQRYRALSAGLLVLVMLVIALLIPSLPFAPPGTLRASRAIRHAGEIKTVCGRVESSHRRPDGTTFLNLGGKYPQQDFTAVIWAENQQGSWQPHIIYLDERICVKGMIEIYRRKPEISVRSPDQIRFQSPGEALQTINALLTGVVLIIIGLVFNRWFESPEPAAPPPPQPAGITLPAAPGPAGTLRRWLPRSRKTWLLILAIAVAGVLLALASTWWLWG